MNSLGNKITYKHIFDSTSNGVIATDKRGNIVLINQQAKDILGFHEKKVIGIHIMDCLPMTGKLVKKCLKTGEPQLGRHILGKNVSLVVNVTTIRENGGIIGAVGNFQKMQQFEHSAQQLESYKSLNKQLETIFTSSSDGIWVCNNTGEIIKMNEASENLNGVKAKDIIGKNIKDLLAAGLFDRSVTVEVLETERRVSILQHIKKTGKTLLLTGTPTFDEEGEIFLVVTNERDITQLNVMKEMLEQTRMETEKFKDELNELNLRELKEQEIIAESEMMRQVLIAGLKLAKMDASNILILGESGTGKGLLAKFIHKNGKRNNKPFIQINCAALPESLLEAELFGYEKGAFTGARKQGKVGLFQLAHEGTLFLDEIGDLPSTVQAKLLKYLDDQEIMRLGGIKSKRVDCTIIAATNRDLEILVKHRKFRQDLFYRLNTFKLQIPPLRLRPDDIFNMVNFFLDKYNAEYKLERRISPKALTKLQNYPFIGNVRELKNVLKMAVVMSENNLLDDIIPKCLEGSGTKRTFSIDERKYQLSLTDEVCAVEKEILKNAMTKCKTTREMANCLNISQPTVVRKLKKHGLSAPSMHN